MSDHADGHVTAEWVRGVGTPTIVVSAWRQGILAQLSVRQARELVDALTARLEEGAR